MAPDNAFEKAFEKNIQDEIQLLLQNRYQVQFKNYYALTEAEMDRVFTTAYSENDILVALSIVGTNYGIQQKEYPKPTIGTIVLDAQLQGVDKTSENTSGIDNFTYIESPFNLQRDLNTLYEIYPYEHLEVLSERNTIGDETFISKLFESYLEGKNVSIDNFYYTNEIADHFEEKGDKKVAVYALPYLGIDNNRIENILDIVNSYKIPSMGLFGESFVQAGALAGYETSNNLRKIPRRIALTIMKIVEGENAANLNVEMQTFADNLLINMETARQISIYPTFNIMSEATLVNLENIETENTLTLQKAVAEALQNNLDISIQQFNVDIANTEVGIAKSDLFPQVDASLSGQVLDELSTFGRQGAAGRGTFYLGGKLSQTVFAEPILANIMIQKMLKESEEKALLQTQLDAVLNVTNAYMNILFAKSNLNIQQQNVTRNKENYDISKAKEAIGYSGASDINRWEAELANANINLNNSIASLRQAKFQLNQILARPISQPLEVKNVTLNDVLLMIADDRMRFLDNYGTLQKFSDFLVKYGLENLPEMAQLDLGLRVQERLQLSRERALYLPSVGINGSANKILHKVSVPELLPPVDNVTTWDISLGVSYPIFQGFNRKKLIEQSKFNVSQINDSKTNLSNQLELLIRANLETVGASFSQMRLSKIAADASQKNYEIVRDAYSAGQANITTVIDAQNNALGTELNATNAIFNFIQDFITLDRSIGYFNFLSTPTERDNFFQQVQNFMDQ